MTAEPFPGHVPGPRLCSHGQYGEHLARGAQADSEPPAVTSPAPAPAGPPGTATGPAEGNWIGRAEQAEARLAEIRAVLLESGQGDATARCRAIAITGIKGDEHE